MISVYELLLGIVSYWQAVREMPGFEKSDFRAIVSETFEKPKKGIL